MNLKTNNKGFTLIELLIVIVVIAILAAISVVAYTGIQKRAKTSTGQQLASQVESKAQAFYTVEGTYPTDATPAAFSDVDEAKLEGIDGIQLISTTLSESAARNGDTVRYTPCPATGTTTGAQIQYWDFTASSQPAGATKTLGSGC